MYTSKLPHTQIDRFHHIARLGVYAMLTLSVIAMTVSLNRPGTSVGNGKARAAESPIYTCKKITIVTSNNGAGEEHASIGADYSNGRLVYYIDINSNVDFGDKITYTLNVQGLISGFSLHKKSGKNATFISDQTPYTPAEVVKGTKLDFSSSIISLVEKDNTHQFDRSVENSCKASLTIGAVPTPTPTKTPVPATPTVSATSPKISCSDVKMTANDAGINFSEGGKKALMQPDSNIALHLQLKGIGDWPDVDPVWNIYSKSGTLLSAGEPMDKVVLGSYINAFSYNRIRQISENTKDFQFNAQLKHKNAEDGFAFGTDPNCVLLISLVDPVPTTKPPEIKLESYSVNFEGETKNQREIQVPKSNTKKIVVTAVVSGLSQYNKGRLNIYPYNGTAPLKDTTPYDVDPTTEGANKKYTWTLDLAQLSIPAGVSDIQANFYPGTDKIHERVIIRVVNDPMTCERKTCSTGSKTYYVGTRSQAGGVQSTAYFTDASCTGTNITQQFLDGSYCGAAPFNPGDGGPVTIPNRLWLKYQITIGNGLVAGDKIVIAAKKQGTNDLKACAGRLGYSEFAMNNQFIECRQGAGTRTLIVKLVGQEEIKSWLAGSELLWGVRKATDTSNTSDPTADKSKGITVFTGRGPTGIVGNIKYTGETEQYVEIPFTIDL